MWGQCPVNLSLFQAENCPQYFELYLTGPSPEFNSYFPQQATRGNNPSSRNTVYQEGSGHHTIGSKRLNGFIRLLIVFNFNVHS